MFDFIRNLFKKRTDSKPGKAPNPRITQADEIRKYAKTHYVTPARKKGETRVSFSAKDIHTGIDLDSRYPLVCASIDAKKFKEFARVELIKREGPSQGVLARWTFKILK